MPVTRDHIGSVRLVDRKSRVVEVLGPRPLGSRRPTDIELRFDPPGPRFTSQPRRVGICFQAADRSARFLVDAGKDGDALLALLASRPRTPARLARPYGTRGWLVEG
jgi:hypothetical protein